MKTSFSEKSLKTPKHIGNKTAMATSIPIASCANSTSAVSSDLESLRMRARRGVDDAIERMPFDQKCEYLEALRVAKNVVLDETDSLLFVRRCQYDVQAAAERLCLYWKERRRVFGPDRAFLPLVLTGDGALTREDVNCLQSGYPALLPDTTSGQKVVFSDRRKCIPNATKECRIRCGFYLQHILAKSDERTQTEGVLGLCLLITPRIEHADFALFAQLMSNAARVFPTKMHMHFIVIPPMPKAGKRYVVQNVVATSASLALQCEGLASLQIHVEREPGQVLEELLELGLTREGIPLSVGGTWKFEQFFHWCRQQEERESAMTISHQVSASGPASVTAASCTNSLEARKSRKRLYDVIHSRQLREKQKEQLQSLKLEASNLKESQVALKAEQGRLQNLLNRANAVLSPTLEVAVTKPETTQC